MSTLADLLRLRTGLRPGQIEQLHRLVGQWQLIADLSFADLVLWVPSGDAWLAVAHQRPTTGPTTHPDEVVGQVREGDDAKAMEWAFAGPRIVREGGAAGPGPLRVRQETVPVLHDGVAVAVLSRETPLAAGRMPSQLDLAYLSSAGELLQMVSEGSFPHAEHGLDAETAPRVGDGALRLDRTGHVVYASPNALSAFRRLGVVGDVLGAHLGQTIASLPADGPIDEPRGSAAVAAALRFLEPRDAELESSGRTVLLRVLPLVPGGEPRGALALVRDVSELRSRDRALLGKDATIREIHHRVKNNLQTVAALLRLQARRLDDPAARAALEESVRRVGSIALVHETLSTTFDEQVAFDEVADRVLSMCAEVAAPSTGVRVLRTGSFGVLAAETATAMALVLTELVQNAVEHGYPSGRRGTVEVVVSHQGGGMTVVVADDGQGLPAEPVTGRLGLQIARTLVESELRGTLTVDPGERGARATVVLPASG